ncbi:hypothetical protein N665_0086s0100 [Sinapis alba]|nr:hypothetical protein N665_0086s0100 [Sinapis alba]
MTTMATQGAWLRMTSSPKLVAKSKELGFVTSQLSGLRISHGPSSDISNLISLPFFPGPLQPIVARRICPFTGKKANRANKLSFSNHKTKKLQFVNLQYNKVWWQTFCQTPFIN